MSVVEVVINRDSWGHLSLTVRSEILGFVEGRLLRNHLPGMFSAIKSESWDIEDERCRFSLNPKPCSPEIGGCYLYDSFSAL